MKEELRDEVNFLRMKYSIIRSNLDLLSSIEQIMLLNNVVFNCDLQKRILITHIKVIKLQLDKLGSPID